MIEGLVQVDTEVGKAFLPRLTIYHPPHNLRVLVVYDHDRDSQHEEKCYVSGSVGSVLFYLLNVTRLNIQHGFFDSGKTLFLSPSAFRSVHGQIPQT